MEELIERIYEFNRDCPEELVQLKFELMRENMFRFFRGTCHLFFEDWSKYAGQFPAPLAWICGDLHVENFGSYKADNGMVYFDLNDFDEAVLAPASWEIARSVASIFIAFDTLNIPEEKADRMAKQFLKSYRQTLIKGKPCYIDPRIANGIVGEFLKEAQQRKYKQLLKKRTGKAERIANFDLDHPKQEKIPKILKKELVQAVNEWIITHHNSPDNYRSIDAVFRIAGTGSIGLDRYAILLKSTAKKEKYFLLDMKQVRPSSLLPYVSCQQPFFSNEAERVISTQRMMQNVAPALLSELYFNGKLFLLQELQPTKDYIDFRLLKKNYRDMFRVIDDMGLLTASAQLRASGRNGSATADALIAFGKEESWTECILEYGKKQVNLYKDLYKQFCRTTKFSTE